MHSDLPIIASNINSIKECLPESYNFLASPNDRENFIQLILNEKENKNYAVSLKTYSNSKFEDTTNFNKFKEILTND